MNSYFTPPRDAEQASKPLNTYERQQLFRLDMKLREVEELARWIKSRVGPDARFIAANIEDQLISIADALEKGLVE